MDFEFKRYENKNGKFYEITSFHDSCDVIEIPQEIDGYVIDGISQKALSWSVNIRLFILYCNEGDYSLAKYILQNTSQALRIRFVTGNAKTELAFAAYNDSILEDTMARAIHLRIEGSGYGYRECVFKDHIDFASYDRQFERGKYEQGYISADIALSRLIFPTDLSKGARRDYEDYCRENTREIVEYLIGLKDKDRLAFLFSNFVIDKVIVEYAIRLCVERKLPGLVSVVMQSRGGG